MSEADLIIIGAGPAGMAAAATAARGGLRVLVLEEQPNSGGQIYRNVSENQNDKPWLGKDYRAGARYVDGLNHPGVKIEFGATVWRLEAGARVVWSQNGKSQISSAPHVLIATGAQERPVPFPGWTLPGVMPAGGAQILMKTSGLVPQDAVLAGSGPLLYLIAAQMIDAGTPPKALVETQTAGMLWRALPHLPKAAKGIRTLAKGLGLLAKISAAGIPRFTGTSEFTAKAKQGGNLQFSFFHKGKVKHLSCSLLLTHQGVIAASHLSQSAGIEQEWNVAQSAWQPVVDLWGQTNIQGLHIAGDGAGIGGAEAAAAAGELAALNILHLTGGLSIDMRNKQASQPRKAQQRALAVRPFLDAVYAPSAEVFTPADETLICRCEEISAAQVRSYVSQGATGLRQIKTALRVGMGPCQGRMCETTVQGLLAEHGKSADNKSAPPRIRSPLKPVSLAELAELAPNHEH